MRHSRMSTEQYHEPTGELTQETCGLCFREDLFQEGEIVGHREQGEASEKGAWTNAFGRAHVPISGQPTRAAR